MLAILVDLAESHGYGQRTVDLIGLGVGILLELGGEDLHQAVVDEEVPELAPVANHGADQLVVGDCRFLHRYAQLNQVQYELVLQDPVPLLVVFLQLLENVSQDHSGQLAQVQLLVLLLEQLGYGAYNPTTKPVAEISLEGPDGYGELSKDLPPVVGSSAQSFGLGVDPIPLFLLGVEVGHNLLLLLPDLELGQFEAGLLEELVNLAASDSHSHLGALVIYFLAVHLVIL